MSWTCKTNLLSAVLFHFRQSMQARDVFARSVERFFFHHSCNFTRLERYCLRDFSTRYIRIDYFCRDASPQIRRTYSANFFFLMPARILFVGAKNNSFFENILPAVWSSAEFSDIGVYVVDKKEPVSRYAVQDGRQKPQYLPEKYYWKSLYFSHHRSNLK